MISSFYPAKWVWLDMCSLSMFEVYAISNQPHHFSLYIPNFDQHVCWLITNTINLREQILQMRMKILFEYHQISQIITMFIYFPHVFPFIETNSSNQCLSSPKPMDRRFLHLCCFPSKHRETPSPPCSFIFPYYVPLISMMFPWKLPITPWKHVKSTLRTS